MDYIDEIVLDRTSRLGYKGEQIQRGVDLGTRIGRLYAPSRRARSARTY